MTAPSFTKLTRAELALFRSGFIAADPKPNPHINAHRWYRRAQLMDENGVFNPVIQMQTPHTQKVTLELCAEFETVEKGLLELAEELPSNKAGFEYLARFAETLIEFKVNTKDNSRFKPTQATVSLSCRFNFGSHPMTSALSVRIDVTRKYKGRLTVATEANLLSDTTASEAVMDGLNEEGFERSVCRRHIRTVEVDTADEAVQEFIKAFNTVIDVTSPLTVCAPITGARCETRPHTLTETVDHVRFEFHVCPVNQ